MRFGVGHEEDTFNTAIHFEMLKAENVTYFVVVFQF